jgi:hypothetical protein
MTKLAVGMDVIVKHALGLEVGAIESINFTSGKVLLYFDYPDCPHFASFNISQIMFIEVRS